MAAPITSTSVRFKLEIPQLFNQTASQTEQANKQANEQEQKLIEFFQSCDYNVTKDGERLSVGGESDEPYFETYFSICRNDGFKADLLSAISRFVKYLSETYDRSNRGTIVLSSPKLFDKSLLCSLKDLSVRKVFFGNIFKNMFWNHWQVTFPDRTPFKEIQGIVENPLLNKLKVHFSFDQPIAIAVVFCIQESRGSKQNEKHHRGFKQKERHVDHRGSNNKERIVYATYKMEVDRESIQKIIVDSRSESHWFRVYLVLNSPVVVSNAVSNLPPGESKMSSFKSDRRLQLPSGIKFKQQSSKAVLTENNIFCLELPEEHGPLLYSIISRLRSRSQFNVEFTAINDHHLNSKFALCETQNKIQNKTLIKSPYAQWAPPGFPMSDRHLNSLCEFLFPRIPPVPGERNKGQDRLNERKFSYIYLIMALLSRGSVVKDQLLLDENMWVLFLSVIGHHFHDDENNNLCESALEDLLLHVDGPGKTGDLVIMFRKFCEARKLSGVSNQLTKEQWDEGYRKVRKVILTPTRKIFVTPETLMSNRTINKFDHDGTRIIRAVFRDDNRGELSPHKLGKLLKRSVMDYLTDGFSVCKRQFGYLGSSSSQMREAGAYFYERYSNGQLREYMKTSEEPPPPTYKPKIYSCREFFGEFENAGSIPLAMARFGQTLTQARVCKGITISPGSYKIIPDVCGGKNAKGDPYTFTDGIGKISLKLATEIAKSFKFPNGFVPSAFQIRFRGMKGMLVVDPGMDECSAHYNDIYKRKAQEMVDIGWQEVKEENDEDPKMKQLAKEKMKTLQEWTWQILFRKSQSKFDQRDGDSKEWPIELVKWSSPTPVTLNRPFINILDYVSASQSRSSHKRICDRIEQLLDSQLSAYTTWIVNEESCRSKLEDMPRRIHFAGLKEINGFNLSTEPFFRSLIKAAVDVSMLKLINKIQIQVPPSLGRSMYGVTDDSGQLQYGQVFFQYTYNISQKCPSKKTLKTIHEGPVMITKFPSTVSGDVRMFVAVDIPALRHLENVIVFPQTGPRPHPDEMAGSDLDGDEYAVIWDPKLFLERNEPAFEYCSDKPKEDFKKEDMDIKMHKFFANYIEQEKIGTVSNNHLYQSDQFGLDAPVCQQLAKKASMVLDFVKSGVPPPPLTNRWFRNADTGKMDPPEKALRVPDFAVNPGVQKFQPIYSSPRLLGTLFRGLRSVHDVVATSMDKQPDIVLDEVLISPGWEQYVPTANEQMARYNAQLRSLMDNSGVQSEAEAFSGYIRETRRSHQDQKKDDLSIFNAEHILENSITELYRKFRKQFFAEFCDNNPEAYLELTVPENVRNVEETDVLKRICQLPSQQMMAKAAAYYRVCYDANIHQRGERLLSFGWIAYDILNYIKQKHFIHSETLPDHRYPQYEAISKHRKEFFEKYGKRIDGRRGIEDRTCLTAFWRRDDISHDMPLNLERKAAIDVIRKYTTRYEGLDQILCIIDAWARSSGLLNDPSAMKSDMRELEKREIMRTSSESRLQWFHLQLLFINFATREIETINEMLNTKITPLEDLMAPEGDLVEKRILTDDELDRLTFSFFGYLSSRRFRRLRELRFPVSRMPCCFVRGEWVNYHKAAIKTYYNILLNLKFDEFSPEWSPESVRSEHGDIREGDPFLIELPKGVDEQEIYEHLKRKTKCTEVTGRILPGGAPWNVRLIISSRGTTETLQQLRDFAAIKIPRYTWQSEDDVSRPLALMSFCKITGEKWNEEKQKIKRDMKEAARKENIVPTSSD